MGNILDDWFGIDQPSIPKPAKAADTATTQAQYNLDALRTNIAANRLDETNPFASKTYKQTGTDQFGNATYGVDVALSPENQALLQQLFQNKGSAGGVAGNLLTSLLGSSAYGANGLPDLTSAIQPMMDRQLTYLQPYFNQQNENRLTELRNRGLEAGNPAYDYEMMKLMQQQDSSVGNYLNSFTNTAMNLWQMPITGIQSLLGMSGPELGNGSEFGFQGAPNVSLNPVDFAGITNQAQTQAMEAYKAEQAQYNATLQAIGGGIGTILGAPAGTLFGGVNSAVAGGLAGMLGLNAPTGGTRTTTLPNGTVQSNPTGLFF